MLISFIHRTIAVKTKSNHRVNTKNRAYNEVTRRNLHQNIASFMIVCRSTINNVVFKGLSSLVHETRHGSLKSVEIVVVDGDNGKSFSHLIFIFLKN